MKLTITRILETSRYLATQVGQQIPDFILYSADFFNQALLTLRNGITYADNMNASVVTVTLQHQIAQVVYNTSNRPLVIHHATVSSTAAISNLIWYVNSKNQLTVIPTFLTITSNPTYIGAPQPDSSGNQPKFTVDLILVFG